MNFEKQLVSEIEQTIQSLWPGADVSGQISLQKTRKEFEGDLTLVVFPLVRIIKGNPEEIARKIGEALVAQNGLASAYNVVKGFLNITIAPEHWLNFFERNKGNESFCFSSKQPGKSVMVEYSSPNTNKPLHLGHIRNCLLGFSVSRIMEASGRDVVKVQIINDRGIHICKSMLAWKKFGAGETPENTGMKGDKLVGKYYVLFDKEYKRQQEALISSGIDAENAAKQAPILLEAQEMLRKWEQGDEDVTQLWEMMNSWVYAGFDSTYARLGVSFEKNYYESQTYLLGKEVVQEGLDKGIFYKKEDSSVWVDLTDQGLDEKLLLRSDGTSVYMTQDIGTAIQRFKDFDINQIIYTVGNEQDYHFKVLFLILEKMGYARPGDLHHLSYGMVDLPSGKMKSREGTVVDADDLMQEMHETARAISEELGKTAGLPEEEKNSLYETIGMGALKYYMLKVDPKKRMMFNPEESIDFNGNTGPFIQYTYARIQSILRKVNLSELPSTDGYTPESQEIELLKLISEFEGVIALAAEEHSPAQIANYTYELVKSFNSFYQHAPILNAADETQRSFRIQLSKFVGQTIKNAMYLLGIEVPSRM